VTSPRNILARLSADEGAAPVEFALVTPLLLLVALAVLQLALALHVRGVAIGAASEGARVAAVSPQDMSIGRQRTERILADSIAGAAIRSTNVRIDRSGPVTVAAVDVTMDLPLVGLLGPTPMTVTGRSVMESTSELLPGFSPDW
jgi:Flp pilus assembly protein TadG